MTPLKYSLVIQVTDSMIDANQHVGNVEYVRLMQDIAVAHSDSVGCTEATEAIGCSWFVRSHTIEYKRPAEANDTLRVTTWIDSTNMLRSTRRYEFFRQADDVLLAEASTDWILVEIATGRPKRIPPALLQMFFETEG